MTHRQTKLTYSKNTEQFACSKFKRHSKVREEKIAEIDKYFSDLKHIEYYPCSLPEKLLKCNVTSFASGSLKDKESFKRVAISKQTKKNTSFVIKNEKTKIGQLSKISSSNLKNTGHKSTFESFAGSLKENSEISNKKLIHRKVSNKEQIQEKFLEDLEEVLKKLLVYMRKQGFTFKMFDCLYDPLVCTQTFKNPFKMHIKNLVELNMIQEDSDKFLHWVYLALSPFYIGSLNSVGLSKHVFRKKNGIQSHISFDILSGCLCPFFTIIQIRNHLNEEKLEKKIVEELIENIVTQHEKTKIERF